MFSVKKIGLVGAGTMGAAIAQHFCMKGLDVVLLDLNAESLERGVAAIKTSLNEAKERKIISGEEEEKICNRLHPSTQKADLSSCGLIIEAIFEDLKVKQKLFQDLERIVSPDCVLATNTSSFLVTSIAEGLKYPDRVIGVHYFYHAAKNKLVELIPGQKTSPQILNDLINFYTFYEKTPILVKDAPGFAVNRFFVPWLNEAARLHEEGFGSIAFIDEVARKTFRIGMGPFALMNATGVPIAKHACEGLAEILGPFYGPANILNEQVALKKNWNLSSDEILRHGRNNEEEIKSRLLGVALGVAAQMVSEGVTDATSADLGARVGLSWPKGPFEVMNTLGLTHSKDFVAKLFAKWKLPLPTFPFSSSQDKIAFDFVQIFSDKDCGFIVFNTPDKMNPLTETTVAQLSKCFDELENRSEIEKIFLMGRGKAFVAGADVKFFIQNIEKGDLDRISRFTKFGQDVFKKINSSSKKTVAYLNGLTLGGGLELALACRYRIGTSKSALAFPETGIGIYPGLGGTQRTPRLVRKGLAKFLIATGQMLNAEKALQYRLIDMIIEPVFDPLELSQIKLPENKVSNCETDCECHTIEKTFENFDGTLTPELFEKNECLKKYEKHLKGKAPLALQKAMSLIDEGYDLELNAGLSLELAALKEIFSTKDAKTGLNSLLKKERPRYIGE